jgi:ferrochelatase
MNKGVLLINLGSPDSPSVPDVRRYLREFLMDERVIDTAWPMRAFVVHGCILPFRPKQSAHAYHTVWTDEGSPLIVTSRRVQMALQDRIDLPIELAMRYQNPSIEDALDRLVGQNVEELFLIPLFPHYAMSSYETAVERVKALLARRAPRMRLRVQRPYFDSPDYISALVASATEYLAGGYDHLLFSFHGVPERQIRKSDPTRHHCLRTANCCEGNSLAHATCYRAQCLKTVKAFVAQAQIPAAKYSVAFQSRLGRDPWLSPATEGVLQSLAANGVKKLLVICPAFVADCLETIEEIGMRGRETFLQTGGKDFVRIPCLNEHPRWLDTLENMINRWRNAESESSVSRAAANVPSQTEPTPGPNLLTLSA